MTTSTRCQRRGGQAARQDVGDRRYQAFLLAVEFACVHGQKEKRLLPFLHRLPATQRSHEKDAYPVPHVKDTLDSFHGAKYFATIDLLSGYWQIGMTE